MRLEGVQSLLSTSSPSCPRREQATEGGRSLHGNCSGTPVRRPGLSSAPPALTVSFGEAAAAESHSQGRSPQAPRHLWAHRPCSTFTPACNAEPQPESGRKGFVWSLA